VTADRQSDGDYFLEIEAHFARRRNTPFILSAKDWALMQRWKEEGIPLPIVIEAIDSVFEKNETSGRRKVISSLSYCRHAVKEIWNDRKELQVGAGSETPEAAPEQILNRLADALEQSVAARVAESVRELAIEKSVPRIEERLIEIEHDLIEEVMRTLPAGEADALRREVVSALGDTSRLDQKTRQRTEEANLRRVVRAKFGLPRLTLF
jgi:phenylalanyl-tRNA synthetase beta subunit